MSEPVVVAAGSEPVRRHLAGLGMLDDQISGYLEQARRGPGPARFSFGADPGGAALRYWLSCDESEFVLFRQDPGAP